MSDNIGSQSDVAACKLFVNFARIKLYLVVFVFVLFSQQ